MFMGKEIGWVHVSDPGRGNKSLLGRVGCRRTDGGDEGVVGIGLLEELKYGEED